MKAGLPEQMAGVPVIVGVGDRILVVTMRDVAVHPPALVTVT
jgi:hypothetical protein